MIRRRLLTINYKPTPVLPYTPVEYIQSDGAQYIDTLKSYNNGYRYVMQCMFLKTSEQYMFGTEKNSMRSGTFKTYLTGKIGHAFLNSYGSTTTPYTQNVKYTFDVTSFVRNFNLQVNNASIKTLATSGTFPSSTNLIFAVKIENNISYKSKAKLYSLVIYGDVNKTTVLSNYVPCVLNQDISARCCADSTLPHTAGTVGLWETVENKFYTNSGTGAFTAGASL